MDGSTAEDGVDVAVDGWADGKIVLLAAMASRPSLQWDINQTMTLHDLESTNIPLTPLFLPDI